MRLSAELISWYLDNKRDLPWRRTTDAYTIWLSEIILQQTRVDQGLPYFHRFIDKYPDLTHFAAASEDEVLKLWQGLGYYSRGRNMLKTAQLVQQQYGGMFPTKYDELIKLKGIGEYTASAISSFAANEPRAVVDGNVYRVLARFFGIDEPINSSTGVKMFRKIADEELDKSRPALHNQAMMEFGAMLCKPKNPACGICPVRLGCAAFKTNAINWLPVKLKKAKVKNRFFNYMLISDGQRLIMNKRNDKDIWANMYDLPMIETPHLMEPNEVLALPEINEYFGNDTSFVPDPAVIKHILTHQRLFIRFFMSDKFPAKLRDGWFLTDVDNLSSLAFPKIVFIFIKKFFNF